MADICQCAAPNVAYDGSCRKCNKETTATQSQASLIDQLKALIPLANRAGLYDAADFLQAKVDLQTRNESKA